MAMLFLLFVECADAPATEACRQHFDGFEFELLSGKRVRWSAGISDFNPGMEAISFDLNRYGISGLQDAIDATQCGLHLLHHLKSAPEFLFARVGIEAGYIPASELPDFIETSHAADKRKNLMLECVLREDLFKNLGCPEHFTEFRPGYVWRKYSGEWYRPLYSGDQPELNAKCRDLFPEYFRY